MATLTRLDGSTMTLSVEALKAALGDALLTPD